jgi:hypothetical protein
MLRKCALVVAFLSGAIGTSQAETYPGGPRYDGVIVIKELSGANCATLSDAVGDKHFSVFRAKVSESGLSEAMSIRVRNGIIYVSAEFDETFAGPDQIGTGTLIIDAFRSSIPDAIFNLKFEPPVVASTTESFSFSGTWKNYKVNGCKATLKGSFKKRPVD